MSIATRVTTTTAEAGQTGDISYEKVISEICELNWESISQDGLVNVAWAYYYFSIQFCENVGIARILYPNDERLQELDQGERNTDNLSPWPGVVETGEKVDHCEFMRRSLLLAPTALPRRRRLESIGEAYLMFARSIDPATRAVSLSSYEDGGLERVFLSMLRAPHWEGPVLQAFRHFLEEHVKLDSDSEHGHGSLCRFLISNSKVFDLWTAFKQVLVEAAPELMKSTNI
ncbi:hypothetical protein [Methylocystis parvus]|uniref:Iron-containing redox enzyme family protein n=1 Tax=Methylocystis parvus TaxID=134 RepID=A0A6B8M0X2_9HYPH|nr:hypothetical protein [Methylocystis parvus]QGM97434.1 hypothetical protein F7D14_08115 [Methylocystis parvus]WBJ98649.1 hypothetical protein MMG94_11495 [Methylocystis parvus OBBP]